MQGAAAGSHTEVTAALFALQQALENLFVRGIKAAASDDVQRLSAHGEELRRAGAAYLAGEVEALIRHVRAADAEAARVLLRTQTALRVFERVLSLDVAVAALAPGQPSGGTPATPPTARTATPENRSALVPVLEELARTVEGLVGSGLTTASTATRQKLDASFKEASRLKLMRLATSLRYVGDELDRFLGDSDQFSARRFVFFLTRTWLIGRGLLEAIREDDQVALGRLLLSSPAMPVRALRLAVIGVHKRALLDGSAAFEFRMITLDEQGSVPRGARLAWSCVFGKKPGVPAEAFLHLPQAQKFTPKLLLDRTEILVTDAAVSLDEHGSGRLMLGPKSTVKPGKKLVDWDGLVHWDRERVAARWRGHPISPLDLEIELQDEVIVTDYHLGAPVPNPYRPEQQVFPLAAAGLELDAVCSTGPDGGELMTTLKAFAKPKAARPPLYGLMHVEMGRLVFQPLTVFGDDGPEYLMISGEKIDLASLMKTMDFSH
ncbi:MAG: hypothetical protein H0T89_25370 [Deltaproteobacteria bacterium]|nr:hypothetical protein [Deltaproteobacteria bacterium]MDQ3295649.1 hypothetical protein [Myxococcota bacterium]